MTDWQILMSIVVENEYLTKLEKQDLQSTGQGLSG